MASNFADISVRERIIEDELIGDAAREGESQLLIRTEDSLGASLDEAFDSQSSFTKSFDSSAEKESARTSGIKSASEGRKQTQTRRNGDVDGEALNQGFNSCADHGRSHQMPANVESGNNRLDSHYDTLRSDGASDTLVSKDVVSRGYRSDSHESLVHSEGVSSDTHYLGSASRALDSVDTPAQTLNVGASKRASATRKHDGIGSQAKPVSAKTSQGSATRAAKIDADITGKAHKLSDSLEGASEALENPASDAVAAGVGKGKSLGQIAAQATSAGLGVAQHQGSSGDVGNQSFSNMQNNVRIANTAYQKKRQAKQKTTPTQAKERSVLSRSERNAGPQKVSRQNTHERARRERVRLAKDAQVKSGKSITPVTKRATKAPAKGLKAVQNQLNQAAAREIVVTGKTLADVTVGHAAKGVLVKVAASIVAAVSTAIAAVVPVIMGIIAILLPLIIATTILVTIVTGIASFFNPETTTGVGSLTGIEAQLASYLKSQGFSDAATASVIANGIGESGLNPNDDSNMDGQFHYAYERALGIWQYTHVGSTPPSETHDCEYCHFKALCKQNNKSPYDLQSQIEFTFELENDSGYWKSRWYPARHRSGYYLGDCGVPVDIRCDMTPEEFMAETDIEVATYSWMACYEGPSDVYSNYATGLDGGGRLAHARRILSALGSLGSGSSKQQAVINAAQSVPSPGGGLCALWVTQVFEAAEVGSFGGDACDLYRQYCTISDLEQIKPGMIVAVDSHPHTQAGLIYGHVGVYIGNGMVRDNIGYIREISLQQWVDFYGSNAHPVRCGWMGGIDISPSQQSVAMVEAAYSIIGSGYTGSGYSWTGSPTSSVFTCSGVIDFALGNPPKTNWPEKLYTQVSSAGNLKSTYAELEYGDLVFWGYSGRRPGHVGIYVGNGQIIDSIPNGGVQVRSVDYMDSSYMGGGTLPL